MSIHWNPDGDLSRLAGVEGAARPKRAPWPEGATAGLLLVAASCFALGAVLYGMAGPRQVVEDSVRR